jgi:hypothetical protein
MAQHQRNISRENDVVTERDMRHSGIPVPGKLGAAKKEAWALGGGILILILIVLAAIIDVKL